ncbi:unnamed protein product [Camellia sinensis]
MEAKMIQLYNQRRSVIAEGIIEEGAIRQSDMHKSIEKGSGRCWSKCKRGKGLITIWNPTEKQQLELIPFTCKQEDLQPNGCLPQQTEHFELFFSPPQIRSCCHLWVRFLSLANLTSLHWLYTWERLSESHSAEPSNSLLAISFSSSYIDCDSFSPINQNLVGSVVGFCNLIKRAKDQINFLWVAEATENSTYSLSYDNVHCSHLKEAAVSAERWAKISSSTIEKLRRKVLTVVGNDEG